ncbi:dipeptidyl-peptidase 3 family protein [Rheinheimera sp. MMS21-TC3]|uniref:dipeptidyl-peptidase 3 family protein n=1 Tax=Rheinheimera sp. MMS21-TC3 TaxID=3072790 RepID=UPI0028C438DB|nr:Zn-dependent hydrolase [Rheinheimera sp. MMS21-TC3]WNO60763.1 Zn-dependent hydrolase [Rheinheimera sp. MMS21-TC3]
MRINSVLSALFIAGVLSISACSDNLSPENTISKDANQNTIDSPAAEQSSVSLIPEFASRLDIYYPVDLTADLSGLSANQHKMLALLIDAAKVMDDLFWQQAFGEPKAEFLAKLPQGKVRDFAEINYGPWDRLKGDQPFLTGYTAKALGAEFYPHDLTKAEFASANFADKTGLYSIVQRDSQGDLVTIAYSKHYAAELEKAAKLLTQAAALAEDKEFAHYLTLRAQALLTDNYQASDLAWMDMKNNPIDVVIGPIENYEDQLYGYRTAFEAYVLVKDQSWSEKLAKYAATLPALQKGLPVDAKYKAEVPGSDADLNAYDIIYYAGHANAGSKTIAINLPNDEQVQLEKGTRRLQLKNAMQAKFEHIMLPITELLIAPEQRQHVTFNAFFNNTMFHEVAHGLGIKNTINANGTVRQALKEHASALEEGKADILGLYMITQLHKQGMLSEGQLEDYYTTFMAGIFRSVRFGASSAHGKANMIRFNYFAEQEAFVRNNDGTYQVDYPKMQLAMASLSELILTLQGDGNYDGVASLVADKGVIKPQLAKDLARLATANIPVDIDFNQGKQVLKL